MKRMFCLALICLATPLIASAQNAPTDPVSTRLREVLDTEAKNLVAAAQEFPVEKYTYHPTPEGMTVGRTMAHIAQINNGVCAKVGDLPAPPRAKLEDTDKDKLVANLQASMDFCHQAFATLTDAKLGDPVSLFGGNSTRFAAALEVTNDFIDHYATLSVYLRLNGMLPPTAQKK